MSTCPLIIPQRTSSLLDRDYFLYFNRGIQIILADFRRCWRGNKLDFLLVKSYDVILFKQPFRHFFYPGLLFLAINYLFWYVTIPHFTWSTVHLFVWATKPHFCFVHPMTLFYLSNYPAIMFEHLSSNFALFKHSAILFEQLYTSIQLLLNQPFSAPRPI